MTALKQWAINRETLPMLLQRDDRTRAEAEAYFNGYLMSACERLADATKGNPTKAMLLDAISRVDHAVQQIEVWRRML